MIEPPGNRSTRQPVDEASELDPSPVKKARLEDVPLQQPRPTAPGRRHASFFNDFVDADPVPGSVSTFVTDWLKSIGCDPLNRSRSDSHLLQDPTDDPISRGLAKSAPEMGNTKDVDEFAMPPTPRSRLSSWSVRSLGPAVSSVLPGPAANSDRPSARSLVEDPNYRDQNLAANISLHPLYEPLPQHITDLVDYIRRDRDSPGPSPDQVLQDADLNELFMGTGKSEVVAYFRDNIFPKPGALDILKRSARQPMAEHTVPNTSPKFRVSTPMPDLLYGYNRGPAFPHQRAQLLSMGTEPRANDAGLLYPFLVVEFIGDGGSMVAATNKCLGGSAACVKTVEDLNWRPRYYRGCDEVQFVDNTSFGIVMSGSEARIYVSWKHDELNYYVASAGSFLLQRPEGHIEFRQMVRNIVDWAKGRRLDDIRRCLDCFLE